MGCVVDALPVVALVLKQTRFFVNFLKLLVYVSQRHLCSRFSLFYQLCVVFCLFIELPQGQVRYLVLDEADKMLSLGFKPHLDRLYGMILQPYEDSAAAATEPTANGKKAKTKKPHPGAVATAAGSGSRDISTMGRPQVLLFSATMPETVTSAAAKWLRCPEVVSVSAGGGHVISRTVTQVRRIWCGLSWCWWHEYGSHMEGR